MKLLVQPDSGIEPLLSAIKQAKKTIDVLIFRLDRKDLVDALQAAVGRGVNVRALIAHTNRGGEKALRKLEMRLQDAGLTVTRTAGDLVRYHGKMMIIDQRVLHVYGFNFTALDIRRSRSFGVTTRNHGLVREALKLFDADCARQPYVPGSDRFIVSPLNARERLAAFLRGARRQLLIYDPNVTDDAMLRILTERIEAGVDVRVIGKVESKWKVPCEKYPGKRLHVRAVMRDGQRAFVGSQSLRRLELERRREIGVILRDVQAVRQMVAIFEGDWAQTDSGKKQSKKAEKLEKKGAKEPGRAMAAAGA